MSGIRAKELIGHITAVVVEVTAADIRDATAVSAVHLVRAARPTTTLRLITAIRAVREAIAKKGQLDALTRVACELVFVWTYYKDIITFINTSYNASSKNAFHYYYGMSTAYLCN